MTLFLSSWKTSHRSRPEQLVGLAIYLVLSAALLLINSWITHDKGPLLGCIVFYTAAAGGAWTLWRRHSIRTLALEMSLYLSQFPLQMLWALSFFLWGQTLPALMLGLLQTMAALLAMLAFWRKDRLSGQWMLLPLLLSLCAVCINLEICLCC